MTTDNQNSPVAPQGEYPSLPEAAVWSVAGKDGMPTLGKGWMFSPVQQGNATLPLFTARQMWAYHDLGRQSAQAAPALEAPAALVVALPAMPPTDDRRPYDDAEPEGYMESDNEWLDRNLAAVRWFIDNHAAIRAALAAAPQAPAAPVPVPAQADPAALLQLAELLESGRSLIQVERKEAADALRLQAAAAPAAPVVGASEPVLGEWPRVSGVGRDAESPRTLVLYLQTEASNDELRAIHDALLDGGALATHALSELMHIGYRVEGGKLVPPEKLSDRASEFFGVSAVAAAKVAAVHSDDAAVDRFAAEMKAKLAAARVKGRGGWETCPPEVLSRMLREHTDKGDPRDVANFCMFLWSLGQPIAAAPAAPAVDAPALGEWVATLEVDSEGGLDYETVPPCTLPPGCYRLYRAAQAKEGGAS